MPKKKCPELKRPKLKGIFPQVSDYKDIVAITEGKNWKPVTRKGRFINANYPPQDATKEELEAIERFWDDDPEDNVPLRDRSILPFRKSGRKEDSTSARGIYPSVRANTPHRRRSDY